MFGLAASVGLSRTARPLSVRAPTRAMTQNATPPAAATGRTSLLFTVADRVGGLEDCLSILRRNNLNMSQIVSRPSNHTPNSFDFVCSFTDCAEAKLSKAVQELQGTAAVSVQLLGDHGAPATPWFPLKPADLDRFARETMEYGGELDADHPGFKDPLYRERRAKIAKIATQFRQGEKIPHVEYSPEENYAWNQVYTNLKRLYPTHAASSFANVFTALEKEGVYGPDKIPQLQEVSDFLRDCSGWTLRPVAGLLSARDFLNALAFRIFHSTQYIRHPSTPLYTPEPDVCHELLGHIPLLADPDFGNFSQELGLASLGASDEDIKTLGTIYWFTVEFGLCKENGQNRAYGAGLLSSVGELEYCLSDKPQLLPFDPFTTCKKEYPITTFQPTYFVTESFEDALRQVKVFTKSLQRPFVVRYNPLTQTVVVLDNEQKVNQLARDISGDMSMLIEALNKLKDKRETK